MKIKHHCKLALGLLVGTGALLSAPVQGSPVFYHFDINTAPLVGNPGGPFSLDFQLNDGSGAGDGNNTATINNFTFGGGAAGGLPTLLGGASGSLAGGITLTDNTAFNEFFQSFTAGSTLGFDLFLSVNTDAGPTPDAFSFSILDNNLMNIPTSGAGDSLLQINISSGVPAVQTGVSLNPSGVAVVPEPSVAAFVVMGLGLAGLRIWRGGRRA